MHPSIHAWIEDGWLAGWLARASNSSLSTLTRPAGSSLARFILPSPCLLATMSPCRYVALPSCSLAIMSARRMLYYNSPNYQLAPGLVPVRSC